MARVGGSPTLGEEASSSARILNLFFTDLTNRGWPLFLLEQVQTTLTSAVATVTPTATTQDIYSAFITYSSSDFPLGRLSYQEFRDIPNKAQPGRPQQFTVNRTVNGPVIYLWPTPDVDTSYVLNYLRIRFVQDAGGLRFDPDFPRRFYPAIVSGLSYFLGLRRPNFSIEKLQWLKMQYEEDLVRAMEEDRERSSLIVVPGRRRWG